MRPRDVGLHKRLLQGLQSCHERELSLPGVQNSIRRDTYVRQLIDSIRRVQFVGVVTSRNIHPDRANGLSAMFDPLRASALHLKAGRFDEACWLAFIFVHFGRHPVAGYRYAREFYGALGQQAPWTFNAVVGDVAGMRAWLDSNEAQMRRGPKHGFGNHRKYLSLSGSKPNATGDAFETYVKWVQGNGGHKNLFASASKVDAGSPEIAFEWLYREMQAVSSFGRIGKFDYLTMLQKLKLANIRPGRPYFDSSTRGPNKGARELLEIKPSFTIKELEEKVQIVGRYLGVGMQEMEDSLCNWGKNPKVYKYFKG